LAEKERRSLAQQAVAVLAKGLEVEVDPRARRRKVLEEAKRLDWAAASPYRILSS
jgi:hypothetical protein